MPIRPCPACNSQTARALDGPSADVQVWYFRCPERGHAWSVSKAYDTATRNPAGHFPPIAGRSVGMPIQPCPVCMTERPVLEGASEGTYVWYFLCTHCGHTWSVSRTDKEDVHHVTALRKQPTAEPPER